MKNVHSILTAAVMLSTAFVPLNALADTAPDNPSASVESAAHTGTDSGSFHDLSSASPWAQPLISTVQHLGLMSGDKSGNFRPHDPITRQEVAAILVNTLKLPAPAVSSTGFSDVTAADWGSPQIAAVAKAGLMNGDKGGTFRPHDPITREEMAAILVHAAKGAAAEGDLLSVADRDEISPWAKGYVQAAMKMGLLAGDGTYFHPKAHAERQEVAAMLLNFLKVTVGNNAGQEAANQALAAVNQAADAQGLQTVLEEKAKDLGIDVSSGSLYGQLKVDRKPAVAEDVYENRPAQGFASVQELQQLFQCIVQTRTVIEQALDQVNSSISVAEIHDLNRSFLTQVIQALQEAQTVPGFVYESGSKIDDFISQLQDLVTRYDALDDAGKEAADQAIQGKNFTSYKELVNAFALAVNRGQAALQTVNQADSAAAMKTALEEYADALGISVSADSAYGQLLGDASVTQDVYADQLRVAQDVYENRPSDGYPSEKDVQALFNQAVQIQRAKRQSLDEVRQASTADALAGMAYLDRVIQALENAENIPSFTKEGGALIDTTLTLWKYDRIRYNALSSDQQMAVNQALAGKSFATYDDLIQALEQALKVQEEAGTGSSASLTATTIPTLAGQ